MQKKIVLLGTGGTIAGQGAMAGGGVDYQAGQLDMASLLQAVPDLQQVAAMPLLAQQLMQIDSKDMSDAAWHLLAATCRTYLAQDDVAAIVITHGTDTLEETAWFLQCVLPGGKPVVLTCAMRPATALSADGPVNMRDAVACAVDAGAAQRAQAGWHVLVVAAGEVHLAEHVRKAHPYRIHALTSDSYGPQGWVEEGGVRWAQSLVGTTASFASASSSVPGIILPPAMAWPWVEVVYSHAGIRARTVDIWVASGVQGLVVAGTGNGTVHSDLQVALQRAQAAGVMVWRCTRCELGRVVLPPNVRDPTVSSLSAIKARISLMLALIEKKEQKTSIHREKIQESRKNSA